MVKDCENLVGGKLITLPLGKLRAISPEGSDGRKNTEITSKF